MNLSLNMSMKQDQRLSFQMIQSLKLLQVNTLQLEQMLKTEMEMNPVLETSDEIEESQEESTEESAETDSSTEDSQEEKESEVGENEIDWEEYLEEGFGVSESSSRETERDSERYESSPVYQATLEEHLTNQLVEKNLPQEAHLLVQFVIGCLSADGYLRLPVEEIAKAANESVYHVEEALNTISNMDPPGLGAKNLQECLILQLKKLKMQDSLAMKILSDGWELFEKLKIPEIARTFGVEIFDVQQAIDVIRKLNPKPGYQVSPERPSTIIPDLIVEKIDNEFVVMLNDRSVPSLRISKAYANLLRRGSNADKEVKKYVREKFNSATWLIRSIEQRKSTMLRVMYAIIDKQRDFFEKGPPNLNPLRLQDIADIIGMHISTISRVTSSKYVQTIHGIYELKYFFTEAVGQDAEGADISSERIRNRLKELVEGENTLKPLSDQKLADILSGENFNVARRTVAKYRDQLKILPARLRQKYEQQPS